MRPAVVAPLLIAVASITGCLGSSSPEAAGEAAADASRTAGTGSGMGTGSGAFVLSAPDLPLGRAWTFTADVIYDPDPELTVVVARKDASGYLFAAGAEDDLYGEAVWGREWYGPMTLDLLDADAPKWPAFAFPLEDGKRWAFSPRLNVTARAADVALPWGGSERGFVIEGSEERSRFRGEYAPSVGWYTTYEYAWSAGAYSLRLESMADASEYVWFEAGPSAYLSSDERPPAATLAVPSGYDAVVASLGGAGGGRAAVAPPVLAGAPWTIEASSEERWEARTFPAHPGGWTLTAQAPPDAWGFAAAMAVRWVHAPVGT